MVTKGSARRSSRRAERRPAARPRPRRAAASGNSSGMPCSWMAISETDLGAEGSPRRATTRARGRPWPRAGPICSASTSSPSRAPARSPARDQPVAVGALVDGGDAAAGLGLVVDADDPARPHADAADDPGGERRVRAVERGHPAEQAVAGAEGGVVAAGADQDARRRGRSPSHSAGSAQRSPSRVGAGDARARGPAAASPCGRTRRRRFSMRPVAAHLGEEAASARPWRRP